MSYIGAFSFLGKGREHEAPRTYYQGQKPDPRMPFEKLGGGDPRTQAREEDMDIGYEDNRTIQSFDGLEQIFLDDIMKLSKEQNDAEDAENARHREVCFGFSLVEPLFWSDFQINFLNPD